MMDHVFDYLNVKNTMEYKVKQKPLLKPYTSVDDVRFAWLDQFLDYFEQWNDKEVCKFLLEQGISYILFGRQRAIGHRRDNPTIRDAGYNDNTIKSQYSVRPIARNVRANLHKFNIIDETPLPETENTKKIILCDMTTNGYFYSHTLESIIFWFASCIFCNNCTYIQELNLWLKNMFINMRHNCGHPKIICCHKSCRKNISWSVLKIYVLYTFQEFYLWLNLW